MNADGPAVDLIAGATAANMGRVIGTETTALAASIARSRPPDELVNSRTGS
jgi:hypothetical protein